MKSLRISLLFISITCGFASGTNDFYHSLLHDSNFKTHQAVLTKAIVNTTDPILEIGCSNFSTPLLHAICSVNKRSILSVENNQANLDLYKELKNDWHQLQFVPGETKISKIVKKFLKRKKIVTSYKNPIAWDKIDNDKHWGVIFIDHTTQERRPLDILKLRHQADIIVIQQSADQKLNYEKAIGQFNYRYVYTQYGVTTTLASETIDLLTLFKNF